VETKQTRPMTKQRVATVEDHTKCMNSNTIQGRYRVSNTIRSTNCHL